eukprot:UN25978
MQDSKLLDMISTEPALNVNGTDTNVRVVCRFRPINKIEIKAQSELLFQAQFNLDKSEWLKFEPARSLIIEQLDDAQYGMKHHGKDV